MTNVYFIRHAEPDYTNHDDMYRPLTEKGRCERALATAYLWDKDIDVIMSSPYVRAYDTVADFAARKGLPVMIDTDFRERATAEGWVVDWTEFSRAQWDDFDYKRPGGESLHETGRRNIAALERVLTSYAGKNIAVGSHGTALSTLIHHYEPAYGYTDMRAMANKMPWAVQFVFDGIHCVSIIKTDLTIRPMTAEDHISVAALLKNAEFLTQWMDNCFVADIGGEITGVLLYASEGRKASPYVITILDKFRGLGLEEALQYAASKNPG